MVQKSLDAELNLPYDVCYSVNEENKNKTF